MDNVEIKIKTVHFTLKYEKLLNYSEFMMFANTYGCQFIDDYFANIPNVNVIGIPIMYKNISNINIPSTVQLIKFYYEVLIETVSTVNYLRLTKKKFVNIKLPLNCKLEFGCYDNICDEDVNSLNYSKLFDGEIIDNDIILQTKI